MIIMNFKYISILIVLLMVSIGASGCSDNDTTTSDSGLINNDDRNDNRNDDRNDDDDDRNDDDDDDRNDD